MRLPKENTQVKRGMKLVFANGEIAPIVSIETDEDGEDWAYLDLQGTRLNENEYRQEIRAIKKWVARGIWRLRR